MKSVRKLNEAEGEKTNQQRNQKKATEPSKRERRKRRNEKRETKNERSPELSDENWANQNRLATANYDISISYKLTLQKIQHVRLAAVAFDTMQLKNESCITDNETDKILQQTNMSVPAHTDHTPMKSVRKLCAVQLCSFACSPLHRGVVSARTNSQVHYFQAVDWKTHKHKGASDRVKGTATLLMCSKFVRIFVFHALK